jgi:hypothetical protein
MRSSEVYHTSNRRRKYSAALPECGNWELSQNAEVLNTYPATEKSQLWEQE